MWLSWYRMVMPCRWEIPNDGRHVQCQHKKLVLQNMGQLIDKNSPLPVRAAGCLIALVLASSRLIVLPALILMNSGINFAAAAIVLNEDGYTRQKYHITQYYFWKEHSGPDTRLKRYFTGTVNGKRHYLEDFTFVRYSPDLDQIIEHSATGKTPLNLTIDIWYNPDLDNSWFTKGNEILPYSPDLFSSLTGRLGAYLFLWVLFFAVWMIIYWLPKMHAVWLSRKNHRQKNRSK